LKIPIPFFKTLFYTQKLSPFPMFPGYPTTRRQYAATTLHHNALRLQLHHQAASLSSSSNNNNNNNASTAAAIERDEASGYGVALAPFASSCVRLAGIRRLSCRHRLSNFYVVYILSIIKLFTVIDFATSVVSILAPPVPQL
jgi:hypothetical protein